MADEDPPEDRELGEHHSTVNPRRLALALAVVLISACDLMPESYRREVPIVCGEVPAHVCEDFSDWPEWTDIEREQVERIEFTCTDVCTGARGTALMEMVLFSGERIRLKDVGWGRSR